eukprot:COSAG06_NODE_202_length_20343_cov_59.390931_1_plen_117_part_00
MNPHFLTCTSNHNTHGAIGDNSAALQISPAALQNSDAPAAFHSSLLECPQQYCYYGASVDSAPGTSAASAHARTAGRSVPVPDPRVGRLCEHTDTDTNFYSEQKQALAKPKNRMVR